MVFSSVSAYLDLPHWQQEHNHNHQIIQEMNTTTTTTNSAATNPIVLPTQLIQNNGSPAANPARPMTVSERARLANIPVPEPALKCPRCDSTNTKFCYFNNYSLTQPRHFCKTCRRYWTRGGALRNVPVGGGCRRTRKPTSSKSTSSKQAASSTTTSAAANTNSTSNNPLHQSLRFLSPPLGQGFLGSADHHLGLGHDSSLMMSGFGEMNVYGSSSMVEPWAQLQFMGGLDPATANYGGFNSCVDDQVVMRGNKQISSSLLNHLGPVKMEGSCNNHNDVSRQLLMNMGGGLDDHHHWNNINSNVNACWNEISGFSSSSASNNALYLS